MCLKPAPAIGVAMRNWPNVFMQHIPEAATQRLLLEKGDIDIARELTPTDIEGWPAMPT
jgi:ABC-type transport system substrate-binding protein